MSRKIIIKRKPLYEQVWSIPMIKLAKEYGISDKGLAKICDKLNIPRPEAGYWRKLETGQKIRQKSLPPLKEGIPNEYKLSVVQKNLQNYPEEILTLMDIEKEEKNKIVVPDKVGKYHPLIRSTRKINQGNHDSYKLSINVQKASLTRAYKIFNCLIQELEKRGYKVEILIGSYETQTVVNVLGQQLKIKMFERQKKKINPEYDQKKWWSSNSYILEPTGIIELQIDEWFYPYYIDKKTVRDTTTKKLEDRLNEFIICLIKAATIKKWREVDRERERKIQEEKERRHCEFVEAFKKEQSKVEEFYCDVDLYYKAYQIRQYILARKDDHIRQFGKIEDDSEFKRWMEWTNKQADRIDPLKESPPSILDEKEKLDRFYDGW